MFAIVLFLTFAIEESIMLAIPYLPSWVQREFVRGIFDATLLTLLMAPAIWWLVVRPLTCLFETRGRLLHALFQVQEKERLRIAHDLHDEIGQHVTAILVNLRTIESATDLDTVRSRCKELRNVAASAHEEVRRLARGLLPGVLQEVGLCTALQRLGEDFQQTHHVAVSICTPPEGCGDIPHPIASPLYRIAQEALTNVARHANASSVEVALTRASDEIVLMITDDGRGFDLDNSIQPTKHVSPIGLASIRERAIMLQGTCAIRSNKGKGTSVRVVIPLPGVGSA